MEDKSKTVSNWLAWFGRLIVFIITSGYIFPHTLTEGMDMQKYDDEARKILA